MGKDRSTRMDATCAPQNASKAFVAASSATQQTAGMVPDVTDQVIMSGAVPAASASQLAAAEEALAGQADFMNGWNANSADLSKFEGMPPQEMMDDAEFNPPQLVDPAMFDPEDPEQQNVLKKIEQMGAHMEMHRLQWECMGEVEKAELEDAGLNPDGSNFDECWAKATKDMPGMVNPNQSQDTEDVLARYASRLRDEGNSELADAIMADPEPPEYKFETAEGAASGGLSEGVDAMKAGDLTAAIAMLEAFCRSGSSSPELVEAWRTLGMAHAERDNDEQAIAALLRANQINPQDPDTLLELGVSCTNELNRKQAYTFLMTWLASQDGSGVTVDAVPRNLESVMKTFNSASQRIPENAGLCTALGVLCNLSSDYKQATQWFKKALQLRPDSHSLWNKLGATQANGGEPAEALNAYNQALALKPGYVRAWNNIAVSHSHTKNFGEAARYFLHALSLHPEAETGWEHLASILGAMADPSLEGVLKEAYSTKNVEPFRPHFQF